MNKEINFFDEYYNPMFKEGCSIWINTIKDYLSVDSNGAIFFTAPNRDPIMVVEGKPKHNYFCHKGCGIRLEYNRRTVKCKKCGYINSFRKYLVERMKIVEQSKKDNEASTNNQLKNRRWINGEEVEFE